MCVYKHRSVFPRFRKSIPCHTLTELRYPRLEQLHTTRTTWWTALKFFSSESLIGKINSFFYQTWGSCSKIFPLSARAGMWRRSLADLPMACKALSVLPLPCYCPLLPVFSGHAPSPCQNCSLKAFTLIFPFVWNTLPQTLVQLISSHHSVFSPNITSQERSSLTTQSKVAYSSPQHITLFIFPYAHYLILIMYHVFIANLFPLKYKL